MLSSLGTFQILARYAYYLLRNSHASRVSSQNLAMLKVLSLPSSERFVSSSQFLLKFSKFMLNLVRWQCFKVFAVQRLKRIADKQILVVEKSITTRLTYSLPTSRCFHEISLVFQRDFTISSFVYRYTLLLSLYFVTDTIYPVIILIAIARRVFSTENDCLRNLYASFGIRISNTDRLEPNEMGSA